MRPRLPSLNALKAFEAAARHESFTRAAEELCVTQGAVSHQVKALEAELGIKLFNRERQRLVITEGGREYLTVLRDAFDRIAVGTERLVQRQSAGVLTVSTSPDFAAKWLVHRLGTFAEAHPSIDLRVSATRHHIDFAREDVDIAVRHGDGNVHVFTREVDMMPGGGNPKVDARVSLGKRAKPVDQPFSREIRRRAHRQDPRALSLNQALRADGDAVERVAQHGEVFAAAFRDHESLAFAIEELDA